MGEGLANESVDVTKKIVESIPAPPGIKTYVTGPSASSLTFPSPGDRSLKLITGLTFGVITVMLLFVYRSIVTVLLAMFMVFLELAIARGTVAFFGHMQLYGPSTFAVNLLTMVAIAAATDYVIFLFGATRSPQQGPGFRRRLLRDVPRNIPRDPGFRPDHRRRHVLPALHPIADVPVDGNPAGRRHGGCGGAALTLGPAIVVVASHFGRLEPKRAVRERFWRRIAAAVVRWPGPILIATIGLCLVGLLALPATGPTTTTATTYRRTSPPRKVSRRPNGTSRPPGSAPRS